MIAAVNHDRLLLQNPRKITKNRKIKNRPYRKKSVCLLNIISQNELQLQLEFVEHQFFCSTGFLQCFDVWTSTEPWIILLRVEINYNYREARQRRIFLSIVKRFASIQESVESVERRKLHAWLDEIMLLLAVRQDAQHASWSISIRTLLLPNRAEPRCKPSARWARCPHTKAKNRYNTHSLNKYRAQNFQKHSELI